MFPVCPFPLWWLREYTLCLIIIIKSGVWTSIHCLGLGHETMVSAVCLSIFLWDHFLWRNGDKMASIWQRHVSGFIHNRTNISFPITKFGTKLSYSLHLQKHVSLFDNHDIHSLQNFNVRGGYPNPKYQILIIAQKMLYIGQYHLFNFCTTQIELKSNAKNEIQIHQWQVGIIGFTNVRLY